MRDWPSFSLWNGCSTCWPPSRGYGVSRLFSTAADTHAQLHAKNSSWADFHFVNQCIFNDLSKSGVVNR